MANQTRDASFRSVIDRFTRELTAVISRQVEEQVSAALSRIQVGGGVRILVEGGLNASHGTRVGIICDQNRAEMSAEEQREARERWNARQKSAAAEAGTEQAKALPAPVPPIVRKAESAEA